jgi:hypothetical protein
VTGGSFFRVAPSLLFFLSSFFSFSAWPCDWRSLSLRSFNFIFYSPIAPNWLLYHQYTTMAGGLDFSQLPPPIFPPIQPPVLPPVQPPVQPPPVTQDIVRLRRTHKDDVISAILSKLSLREKLATNKDIEEKNKEREARTLRNKLDPDNYPDTGSDTASLITIDQADIEDLKDQTMFARFLTVLPDSLIQRITRENHRDKEEREKRKRDDTPRAISDDFRDVKRRCMDGDKAANRIIGLQNPIDFSEIMYTTDNHIALPLPFFQNKHLRYIIDHGATLPTIKSNPKEGESKGAHILDVAKLTTNFGAETTLDFGQWNEAAGNCYRFQMSRDRNGDSGSYAYWWSQHFEFFNKQEDKIEMYDAWKLLELRLRREYRTQPTIHDANYYATQYELCKSEYRSEKRLKEMFSRNYRPTNNYTRDDGRSNKNNSYHPRGSSTSSFPPSNRRTALPVCCILCGEKGHPVGQHYNGNVPTKGSDGKSVWAKVIKGQLCTPDGQGLCINHNVRSCTLPKCERAHVCSFCGSKNHNAFSWSCRSRPYSID